MVVHWLETRPVRHRQSPLRRVHIDSMLFRGQTKLLTVGAAIVPTTDRWHPTTVPALSLTAVGCEYLRPCMRQENEPPHMGLTQLQIFRQEGLHPVMVPGMEVHSLQDTLVESLWQPQVVYGK